MRVDLALGRICKISPPPGFSSLRRSWVRMEIPAQLCLHIIFSNMIQIWSRLLSDGGQGDIVYILTCLFPIKFTHLFRNSIGALKANWAAAVYTVVQALGLCPDNVCCSVRLEKVQAENKKINYGKWIFIYFSYFLRLPKMHRTWIHCPLRTNDIFYSYQPSLLNEPWNHLKCAGVCMHACPGGQGGRGNQRHLIRKHSLFGTHNLI